MYSVVKVRYARYCDNICLVELGRRLTVLCGVVYSAAPPVDNVVDPKAVFRCRIYTCWEDELDLSEIFHTPPQDIHRSNELSCLQTLSYFPFAL